MHVGMDLIHLEPHSGGTGTYARELMGALLAVEPDLRITAFVGSEVPPWFDAQPWREAIDVVPFDVTVTHGPPHNAAKLAALHWGAIPWLARRRKMDVVHGQANVVPLVAPGVATVATVLDLIWMRFATTMTKRDTLGMKLSALPSARRADRIIAISEATRQDVMSTLGLPGGRIDVVHLGMRAATGPAPTPEAELRARLGLGDGPVVLTLGQKREHKNQLALIRALPADATLVLPGAETPYEATLREAAEGRRVVFPDWIDNADLEGLYALASVFALPSLEEGFGLPVLEAMARGVPVACSDTSSLPEIAGDAAELFDPRDDASITAALERLLNDPQLRARRAEQGLARVRQFTWERCAEQTLDVYRRALE